jgi:hypothetical protein
MERGEIRNPVLVLILPMLTCGIYGIIWFFGLCDDLNKGLGRQEFNAGKELLLSIVTCGFWAYYFLWRACEAIVEIQNSWGVKPQMDAPIMFVMALFGIGPFFMQQSLNNAWENGTPGGVNAPY